MWNWKELPCGSTLTLAGYDQLMRDAGEQAASLQEQIAGVKGQLNARLARQKK